ncbi:hypothetical protein KQI69_00410 [Eubacterium sp. MSJ-13]|uniref:DUF6345 domain-containing protein n=1 Tax=Eubacterium sp. MSJ-13 TaxID=2841513 RepID=UPI001C1081A4|nr:DUF6345 domain-containing protein [Eubacterium sp. MSJ-13]MBU5477662.1 hypothetical protein [Eubacterium sp. MSJ-13]
MVKKNFIRKLKKLFILVFACLIVLSGPAYVSADSDGNTCSVGIATVGKYTDWDDLDDLEAPSSIANDIYENFKSGQAKKWSVGFLLTNTGVFENVFKGKSLNGQDDLYADNVDLLFYSGHGLKPNKHGAGNYYSFALDYKKGKHYAKQTEMYLGNKDLEWFVTFTCNFLNGGLSSVGHMAKGVHSICGYTTTTLLVSNMGSVMCNKLKKGISVKEAFFATADETQPWSDFHNRQAAVFTTKDCAADRIWGYGSQAEDPKPYSDAPKDYVMYYYRY